MKGVLPVMVAVALCAIATTCAADPVVGGRVMQDWMTWTSVDDDVSDCLDGDFGDGTEFRRARVFVRGDLSERLAYKVNFEFADGDASFKEIYMDLRDVPVVGDLRVGRIQEPFGLDQLTSNKYSTFMERSLLTAFAPSFNSGLMVTRTAGDDVLGLQAGVFRATDSVGDAKGSDGRYSVTARLTGLPYRHIERRVLVHAGVAASYRNPDGGVVRYRERPEIHMSPVRFVDTDSVPAERAMLLGVELAAVVGPFSIQSEYAAATATSPDSVSASRAGDDPTFEGLSVQVSYFLTGESRPYKNGVFSRVSPRAPFLEEGGPGAWELAVRYSRLDLNDDGAGVAGGLLNDVTVGLNWYLHARVRVMLNYVAATVSDGEGEEIGSATALAARVQFDF